MKMRSGKRQKTAAKTAKKTAAKTAAKKKKSLDDSDSSEDDDRDGDSPIKQEGKKEEKKDKKDKKQTKKSSKKFSSVGFVMGVCSVGLDVASTSSDKSKRRNIKFIEAMYGACFADRPWGELGSDDKVAKIKQLNATWSKSLSGWRAVARDATSALLLSVWNDETKPTLAYFQVNRGRKFFCRQSRTNIVARQAMLGVENGQAFLRRGSRPHPCWAGLGVDVDLPQAHIFQTQAQFRQGKHTLVTPQETEFQKHFVKHGLCEYP